MSEQPAENLPWLLERIHQLALRSHGGEEGQAHAGKAAGPRRDLRAAIALAYAAGLQDGSNLARDLDEFMTPAEVLALIPVDRKTVLRWANKGVLRVSRTAGGHRRYLRKDVTALLLERGWLQR